MYVKIYLRTYYKLFGAHRVGSTLTINNNKKVIHREGGRDTWIQCTMDCNNYSTDHYFTTLFIVHIMNNREQKVSIFNDDYNDLVDSAHEHLKFLNEPIDRDEQPSNEPTVANITKLKTLGE